MTLDTAVNNILINLEQQKSCYGHLLALLARQLAAISGNDDEDLFRTVQDKNQWILKLKRLEEESGSAVERFTAAQRQAFIAGGEPLRRDILAALDRLIDLEEECERAIKEKRIQIQQDILDLKLRKTLFKGYQGLGKKGSRFSDSA